MKKILPTETLRQTYPKLNAAIDNSNAAIIKSNYATTKSDGAIQRASNAETIATSVQSQLDNIVIESGTSDAETLQARTGTYGNVAPNLKTRVDELEHFINVKSYGAVGDYTNDDTAAIQAVLDIAETHGQVSVYVPAGIYKVTAKLIVHGNTHIRMSPNAVIKRSHNASILQNGRNGATFYGYEGNGNIVIEGGVFDGNLIDYNFECSGFSVSHAQNIILRDVTFKDLYAGHALDLAGVKDVLVDNCKFIGYRDRADQSRNYAEAIQIDIATTGSFPAFGAPDGTATNNVTVRNCYFGPSGTENTTSWPVGVGQHMAVHDIWPSDITVVNNTFEECPFRALRIFKFKNVFVESNTFRNCFGSINVSIPSPNSEFTKNINGVQMGVSQESSTVIIRGNIIEGTIGDVAHISINGVSGVYTENVKIVDNTLKDLNVSGGIIYLNYTDSIDIKGNKFYNSTRALWVRNSLNVNFDSNTCGIMQLEMIYAQLVNNLSVVNNTVKETGRAGINYEGVVGGVIQSNLIGASSTESLNERSGIFIGSSSKSIKIAENIIPAIANMYGIQVTSTCENIQIGNNDVSGLTGAVSIPSVSGYVGFSFVSPNGTKYKASVDNSGSLQVSQL
ncbi:right-handed parallel beta-helix repeat-containing protein [Cytobacillus kochii]|uniref:right-handed parallel beta-helix repeat-containing protein n=1 Tax=Cytobacillus kochii TaxID=859143 RepID=UPI001CD6616D|nr:right-handed parallel beta-helix repeat-containing protein [Cytobacillus kochii]MCA1027805.1 right-handed parallel beta-helix repeat-containing protein [Cytobacillus kochii]